jgi:hypothetical protein
MHLSGQFPYGMLRYHKLRWVIVLGSDLQQTEHITRLSSVISSVITTNLQLHLRNTTTLTMPEATSEVVLSPTIADGSNGNAHHSLGERNRLSPLTPLSKPTTESAFLQIIDSRTGLEYKLPIERNAVNAGDFKAIKSPLNTKHYADQNEQGLRVYDPGFSNTAVSRSSITYV